MHRPTLIIGTEPRVLVNVARSLNSHGVTVHAGNFATDPVRIKSSAIGKVLVLAPEDASDDVLTNGFRALIAESGYDTIIPCSDTALSTLARITHELGSLAHISCPPPHVLRRVLNKQDTLDAAVRCGVPIPTQWKIGSADELSRYASSLKFPLVAKPLDKHFSSAFKVRYLDDLDAVRAAYVENERFGERYLLQEYCPGQGVGVEVLIHDGCPVAMFQHRRVTEFPASGGVSVTAVAEPLDAQLARYALTLLQQLQWTGIAMVEFRHDRHSNATSLMEINGRYWGSLALSRHAGLEFPWYEWQLHHGKKPAPPSSYRTDVRFHWLVGDLRRATDPATDEQGRGARAVWRILFSSFFLTPRQTVDALWSWQDPLPSLKELSQFVREFQTARIKVLARTLLSEKIRSAVSRRRTLRRQRDEARKHGLRESIPHELLSRARHLIFVCHGNIIRSAFAEALLKDLLRGRGDFDVESVGVAARPGRSADLRVITFAASLGIDMSGHRSRSIDEVALNRADLVFVMDYSNATDLLINRSELRDKVVLLAAMRRKDGEAVTPIEDPYTLDQLHTEKVLRRVERNVRRLAEVLIDGRTRQGI